MKKKNQIQTISDDFYRQMAPLVSFVIQFKRKITRKNSFNNNLQENINFILKILLIIFY